MSSSCGVKTCYLELASDASIYSERAADFTYRLNSTGGKLLAALIRFGTAAFSYAYSSMNSAFFSRCYYTFKFEISKF